MNNKITVIGAGKLGLGLALLFEKYGYEVCGVDINQKYIDKINKKIIDTKEPGYNELLKNSKNLFMTTDLEYGLNYSNIIFILVQTPNSGGNKFYDHSILSNLLEKINRFKVKNKDLIIGCTVMPKYILEVGQFLVSDCQNTFVSYNPEFVAQGDIINGYQNTDIILLGTLRENLIKKLENIYSKIIINSKVKYLSMSPLEAEIVKISINGYITTKLSFANMITDLCNKNNASPIIVLNAVGSDSRIGNKYFNPGYSFGGPCFPRDTKALKKFVDESEINSNLLEATTDYNNYHIKFQSQYLIDYYDNNPNEVIIIEGICYKENCDVPIIEESAKLKIAFELYKYYFKYNREIIIKDKKNLIDEVKKEYGNIFKYSVYDPSCIS